MKPLLIAVTGPDGSGKSTACRGIREALASTCSIAEVSVWDSLVEAFPTKPAAERYLADLDGPARCLFIFHALGRALQLARRSDPEVLLLNGYWYKYAVSELGYGVPRRGVMGAARFFPSADRTFNLRITPEAAWRRRESASAYEQGGAGSEHTRERFVSFQTKLRAEWKLLERSRHGANWISLEASLPPAELVSRMSAEIAALVRMRRENG